MDCLYCLGAQPLSCLYCCSMCGGGTRSSPRHVQASSGLQPARMSHTTAQICSHPCYCIAYRSTAWDMYIFRDCMIWSKSVGVRQARLARPRPLPLPPSGTQTLISRTATATQIRKGSKDGCRARIAGGEPPEQDSIGVRACVRASERASECWQPVGSADLHRIRPQMERQLLCAPDIAQQVPPCDVVRAVEVRGREAHVREVGARRRRLVCSLCPGSEPTTLTVCRGFAQVPI